VVPIMTFVNCLDGVMSEQRMHYLETRILGIKFSNLVAGYLNK